MHSDASVAQRHTHPITAGLLGDTAGPNHLCTHAQIIAHSELIRYSPLSSVWPSVLHCAILYA
nr:MAG TPA: hypothetical protein [Caudoviricetes sp.]